ncbi:alpha/beta fold hydrolase [Legionella rowbothamii]|uniref:alpha/beta fold hydrolase n=1 Tax=Legionella rowbothamii TaxID=96229 RepID=UPI0010546EA8|nr:alpha/beta hydrolase [Legionella rowbothamii]
MKEYTYHYNSLEINYAEGPNNGPPMLLLHGATHRWQNFAPIIPELRSNFHLYGMDFRGHGKSQKIYGKYRLEDYIEDTESFIQDVIKQPTILIGHSLGGMVSSMMAAYTPLLVKALIIIETPLNLYYLRQLTIGLKEPTNLLIQGLHLSKMGLNMDHFIPEHLRQCDPDMLSTIIHQFDETFENYNEHVFEKIQCPTLLIYGSLEQGGLISNDDIERILHIKPNLAHIKISQAGHSPIQQDRAPTLKAIKQFIKDKRI